jgi:hypothetical protein
MVKRVSQKLIHLLNELIQINLIRQEPDCTKSKFISLYEICKSGQKL